jgi:hypothetical protein
LHAVLSQLGPVGDVFNWLLKQAGQLATLAWRETLNALQAFGRSVRDALNWAKAQSEAILRKVIAAAEAAGAMVSELIAWAQAAGEKALSLVSELLYRAGHTVDYILLWLEKDVLEGVKTMVRGLLNAGAAVADLMAWAVQKSVEIMTDVVAELLKFGVTMAQLVADTIAHPENAMKNLVKAFEAAGKTLKDIVQAAVVQPTEEAARRVFATLKALGKSALTVLEGALEIGGSAIALALTLVLEWFPGEYRQLTASELADAKKVFGKSVDLAKVRLAVMSLPVDLVQRINGERAFTTMYLINFASWNELDRPTLIHEITHVWQSLVEGPFYMVEAIHGQMTVGYNYGYTDAHDGAGAEDELNAAAGDFESFNREQQAAIIEHYFVRRFFEPTRADGTSRDWSAWQPYAQQVFA